MRESFVAKSHGDTCPHPRVPTSGIGRWGNRGPLWEPKVRKHSKHHRHTYTNDLQSVWWIEFAWANQVWPSHFFFDFYHVGFVFVELGERYKTISCHM